MNFEEDTSGAGDMDPEQAAEYAQNGASADTGDAPAEPSSGFGRADSPLSRLFDGNADGPTTGELQTEYSLDRAEAVTGRGILRVATGSGVPPVAEILLGFLLMFKGSGSAGALMAASDDESDGDGDSTDDGPEGVQAAQSAAEAGL